MRLHETFMSIPGIKDIEVEEYLGILIVKGNLWSTLTQLDLSVLCGNFGVYKYRRLGLPSPHTCYHRNLSKFYWTVDIRW